MAQSPHESTIVPMADRVAQLTRNAIEAGYLAPDVTGDDVTALLVALRGVIAASPEGDDASWRRFLPVHLTGLRAGR